MITWPCDHKNKTKMATWQQCPLSITLYFLSYHCILFTTACHLPLSIILYYLSVFIVCHSPLQVIPHCLSFPIIHQYQLSVLSHMHCWVISYYLWLPIVCYSPLSVIYHSLPFVIVYLSFSIVCHLPLSFNELICKEKWTCSNMQWSHTIITNKTKMATWQQFEIFSTQNFSELDDSDILSTLSWIF